jgi:hypothetical protein
MSRKQRSLARKMHNKLYLNEASLSGKSVLEIFRIHHRTSKTKINDLEMYYYHLYVKLREKEEMKKKFLSETLPRIKEANKRREAAYLAAIGK